MGYFQVKQSTKEEIEQEKMQQAKNIEAHKKQLNQLQPFLDKALPNSMCSDRLIMLAICELKKNPKLSACTPKSLCGTIMSCAQLGLEPGMAGMIYLIPRGNDATITLGYKGMIELAYRSERITSIEAACVYEKDEFKMTRGTNPSIEHSPSIMNRGAIIGTYAVVTMRNGYKQFDFMSYSDINSIRTRSKSGSHGPWATDFEQMAQKTVIRRLLKIIPSSICLNNAIGLDEAGDRGEQNMDNVVEGMLDDDVVVDIKSQSESLMDKLKE